MTWGDGRMISWAAGRCLNFVASSLKVGKVPHDGLLEQAEWERNNPLSLWKCVYYFINIFKVESKDDKKKMKKDQLPFELGALHSRNKAINLTFLVLGVLTCPYGGGARWSIISISRSLTFSHLQSSFCHVRRHTQIPGTMAWAFWVCHYSTSPTPSGKYYYYYYYYPTRYMGKQPLRG